MNDTASLAKSRIFAWRLPLYYGWVNVLFAAAAMTATLPGRTHGLGLITEPLITDLGISRALFAEINLASTLLGAAFCVPIGWWIDRYGVRAVGTGVLVALSACVWAMAGVQGAAALFVSLLLVRGLGQSALSVTSIAMVSKWFRRRQGLAMGVFAVLLTFGFIGSILALGGAVTNWGWRSAWGGLAISLGGFAPLAWCFVRNGGGEIRTTSAENEVAVPTADPLKCSSVGLTLAAALRTPAFWVFALGTAAFNFVWTALTLFNEAILAERGLGSSAVAVMAVLTGCGLIANLVGGALANRERLGRLLAVGLGVLAVGLGMFPRITSPGQLHAYAIAIGLSGGIVTVIFFTAWSQLFGALHVGKILGAAQLLTVCASALGPVFAAQVQERYGSFTPMFYTLTAATLFLAVGALIVKLPSAEHLTSHQS
jgi:MFS family permease